MNNPKVDYLIDEMNSIFLNSGYAKIDKIIQICEEIININCSIIEPYKILAEIFYRTGDVYNEWIVK